MYACFFKILFLGTSFIWNKRATLTHFDYSQVLSGCILHCLKSLDCFINMSCYLKSQTDLIYYEWGKHNSALVQSGLCMQVIFPNKLKGECKRVLSASLFNTITFPFMARGAL